MKINDLILAPMLVLALASCKKEGSGHGGGNAGEKTVEIQVSMTGNSTRSPEKEHGHLNESRINELDLLVFDTDGNFLYSREAVRLTAGGSGYRVLMQETQEELVAYVFANSRQLLRDWEAGTNKGNTLTEIKPRLLTANADAIAPSSLPMWGVTGGRLSTDSAPTKWGTVQLLRSVASVDVYVENNDKTSDFELAEAYLYFAPDQGYLAPDTDNGIYTYRPPAGMATRKVAFADNVENLVIIGLDGEQLQADAVAYQLYLYENDAVSTAGSQRRPTRVIIGGYYKQEPPQPGDPDTRKKSYYPIDIVYPGGNYRPVYRNWKYEFKVFAVNGPGKETPGEAAESNNTDLNIDIIAWDKDDVEIGVAGKYYVSMDNKRAVLTKDAGSASKLNLSYRILDEMEDEKFSIAFTGDHNGSQVIVGEGEMENEYFNVKLSKTSLQERAGTVEFVVTALKDYTAGHNVDTVLVSFRSLRFEIGIIQVDRDESNWEDGGDIDTDV